MMARCVKITGDCIDIYTVVSTFNIAQFEWKATFFEVAAKKRRNCRIIITVSFCLRDKYDIIPVNAM